MAGVPVLGSHAGGGVIRAGFIRRAVGAQDRDHPAVRPGLQRPSRPGRVRYLRRPPRIQAGGICWIKGTRDQVGWEQIGEAVSRSGFRGAETTVLHPLSRQPGRDPELPHRPLAYLAH